MVDWKNKEEVREYYINYSREYYKKNKDVIKAKKKKYAENNKEVLRDRFSKWYDKNKDIKLKYQNKYSCGKEYESEQHKLEHADLSICRECNEVGFSTL